MASIQLPSPACPSPERDRMPGRYPFPLSPNGHGRDDSGTGEGLHGGQKSTFGNLHAITPAYAHAAPNRETLWVSLALLLVSAIAMLLAPP